MTFSILSFSKGLVNSIKNKASKKSFKLILSRVMQHNSLKLWSISKNRNEFDRMRRVADKYLDSDNISEELLKAGVAALVDSEEVLVLSDISDIRKPHSSKLESLGKVRDLKGDIINGYSSFNSVAVDFKKKEVNLLSHVAYSNREKNHISNNELKEISKSISLANKGGSSDQDKDKDKDKDKGKCKLLDHPKLKILESGKMVNLNTITSSELTKINTKLKEGLPSSIKITHVLDRGFDDVGVFNLIEHDLNNQFVIRLKKTRKVFCENNLSEGKVNECKLKNQDKAIFDKIIVKNKCYQQAKALVEWGKVEIKGKSYSMVRVSLTDRKGNKIFKDPMILVTNIQLANQNDSWQIYKRYLIRAKIENVFKFAKETLGWESMQVRDYASIKGLISLCFFVAAYFYAIGDRLSEKEYIVFLAELGEGKGKVTRHFILLGIRNMLIHYSVGRFFKENKVKEETKKEMEAMSYGILEL